MSLLSICIFIYVLCIYTYFKLSIHVIHIEVISSLLKFILHPQERHQ